MELTTRFTALSDLQLAAEVPRLAQHERSASADLVACLAEFDRRRIYLAQGFTSIYAYCRDQLHLTEGAAYRRIETARASRRFPLLLEMLRDGRLTLATASLIGSKLTSANMDDLLSQATHKSKRDVELLLATLNPQPPVPSVIRKLPAPRRVEPLPTEASRQNGSALELLEAPATQQHAAPPASSLIAPQSRRPVLAPLSASHFKLQVTIGAPAHARLRNIQDLMRHANPSGDAAVIVERALEVLETDLLKRKAAEVSKPRATRIADGDAKGRHIPASVTRAVWRRDQARCAFVSDGGRKCGSTSGLEFHHVQPFAAGGVATVENIELRCRAHNGFEWELHLDRETAALAGH